MIAALPDAREALRFSVEEGQQSRTASSSPPMKMVTRIGSMMT